MTLKKLANEIEAMMQYDYKTNTSRKMGNGEIALFAYIDGTKYQITLSELD